MFLDEHQFMTEVLMPFLRKHWHDIDVAESAGGEADGRISREELQSARDKAIERADYEMANILSELLFRYDAICNSYGDSFERSREGSFGISQDDISVYAKSYAPDYRKAQGRPSPENWMCQE